MIAITPKQREVLMLALVTYGTDAQFRQLQEECAELIVAVNHLARERIGSAQMADEVADVLVMCAQAALVLPTGMVQRAIDAKMARLSERLRAVTGGV